MLPPGCGNKEADISWSEGKCGSVPLKGCVKVDGYFVMESFVSDEETAKWTCCSAGSQWRLWRTGLDVFSSVRIQAADVWTTHVFLRSVEGVVHCGELQ